MVPPDKVSRDPAPKGTTASIPDEQALSGLRPIPHGALPSVPSAGVVLAAVSRGRREPEPGFPGLSRYTGPWWLSPRGEGTGEGARPVPGQNVIQKFLSGIPTPPGLRRGIPVRFFGSPHPARPSASSPAPGGGGSQGDTQWKAVPGGAPRAGFPGEGSVSPDPVRSRDLPRPAGGSPYVPPQSPRPRRGQYVAIPGKSRLPGCKPPASVKQDRYSPPLSVPVIENRCTTAAGRR